MTRPNGRRVRELREGLGWTQERLARKIRRTRQAVSKAEAGKPVSETLMTQVARALKVEFSEIAEIAPRTGIAPRTADADEAEAEAEPAGVAA
jgi:transcriptional regulator with XRE-family HTH domain